jgi:hypothetical protein
MKPITEHIIEQSEIEILQSQGWEEHGSKITINKEILNTNTYF